MGLRAQKINKIFVQQIKDLIVDTLQRASLHRRTKMPAKKAAWPSLSIYESVINSYLRFIRPFMLEYSAMFTSSAHQQSIMELCRTWKQGVNAGRTWHHHLWGDKQYRRLVLIDGMVTGLKRWLCHPQWSSYLDTEERAKCNVSVNLWRSLCKRC